MQIRKPLILEVNNFINTGDRSFLKTLKALDRNNIEGQAVIRFLIQKKLWTFVSDSDFSDLLDHFFGYYPERLVTKPESYRQQTFDMIKSAWNYECVVEILESKVEVREKPKEKKSTPLPDRDEKITKSSSKAILDTTGASDRLKKIIAIQRGD